jgi:hypothetical protein
VSLDFSILVFRCLVNIGIIFTVSVAVESTENNFVNTRIATTNLEAKLLSKHPKHSVLKMCIAKLATSNITARNRDGVIGIATCYGLESPGIEFRWGRDFPHLSRPAPRPTQPPVQSVPGLSRG